MNTYNQTTGVFSRDGIQIGEGYSGHEEGRNNPKMDAAPNVGPLPAGKYTIGESFDHPKKGPVVMRLIPDPKNIMHNRSAFMIHGDSLAHPGFASEGCIVLPRKARLLISESKDRDLEVIAK